MNKELDLTRLKKEKVVAMLAPSFVAEFNYPEIIGKLKNIGFEKVVELTFGAKLVNREYHQLLEKSSSLIISSVCPGIVNLIENEFPEYKKNLAKIDSPMIATAKICKKIWKYKTCFISPCNFKKIEASNSKYLDYIIDYQRLKEVMKNIKTPDASFDRFYNEYTRIYPLSGGLSKTAHLKGVLKPGQEKIIDGFQDVKKFIRNPENIKFLDCTFCKGGCVGGPYLSSKNLATKRKKVLAYLEKAKKENIPGNKLGIIKKAENLIFIK